MGQDPLPSHMQFAVVLSPRLSRPSDLQILSQL